MRMRTLAARRSAFARARETRSAWSCLRAAAAEIAATSSLWRELLVLRRRPLSLDPTE